VKGFVPSAAAGYPFFGQLPGMPDGGFDNTKFTSFHVPDVVFRQ
jgi:hypothetical protein